jgi:hypothetical protein
MFGLMQYNTNARLITSTGFMLTPLASALHTIGYSSVREEIPTIIMSEETGSTWGQWLTSGYVGDFLGWTGKQLAQIGQDLFPEYSLAERQRRMEYSKEELQTLIAESLLTVDEDVNQKIQATLAIYLKQGVTLMGRGALDPEVWKEELLTLKAFASRAGQDEVVALFEENVEQLDLLFSKKAEQSHANTRQEEAFSSMHAREHVLDSRQTGFPNTFDVTILNANSNPQGFQLTESYANSGYGARFGCSVSGAGDVNRDGYSDMVVGSSASGNAAYVIFGQEAIYPNTFDVTVLSGNSNPKGFKLTEITDKHFGYSVSTVNDINRDGYDDIIVGGNGVAYVIFGQGNPFPNTFDAANLSSISDPKGFKLINSNAISAGGFWFGSSVSSAGDVNRDGYDDMIVGASGENSQQGAAYVVFGQSSAFPDTFDVANLSNTSNPQGFKLTITNAVRLGISVSSAGDVNRDGYDDMIVGASGSNSNLNAAAYVIFGQGSVFPNSFDVGNLKGISNPSGFKLIGYYSSSFGYSVGKAGDVNRDGYDDMIVGAQGENSAQGAAYIIFGQSSAFPDTFNVEILNGNTNPSGFKLTNSYYNNGASVSFGWSVSGAGDVNKDGYDDITIGAVNANRAYVVFGQGAAFPNTFDVKILTGSSNPSGFQLTDGYSGRSSFGGSVNSAGDINKDGYDDIIIGASEEYNGGGASYVIFGEATSNPNPTPTPSSTRIPTPSPISKNANPVLIGGIAGAAAILGLGLLGGGYCFWKKNSSKNKQDYSEMPSDKISLNRV